MLVFLIVFAVPLVLAHQPHLVETGQTTYITNPEVSTAYYGNLSGRPAVFIVSNNDSFNLFVQILLPSIKDLDFKTIGVITKGNETVTILDGSTYNWTAFHEDFANDDYWVGPNYTGIAQGTYTITISNTDNKGKYVLVVGQKEEFPPSEIIRTITILPRLKIFMEKSPYTAYFNKSGMYMLLTIIIIAIIVLLIVLLPRRLRKIKR